MSSNLHSDRLEPSDKDMQFLVGSVIERIRSVSEHYLRQWRIPINTDLINGDLVRLNTLFERYEKNDFRHTESEKKAVRTLAQWTIDQKSTLTGQPTKKMVWRG